MIKTCPVCGKQFESNDMRKVYCSKECVKHNHSKLNSRYNIRVAQKKRMEWAYIEAEKVSEIAITTGGNYMDELADYIYNNYNKRSK